MTSLDHVMPEQERLNRVLELFCHVGALGSLVQEVPPRLIDTLFDVALVHRPRDAECVAVAGGDLLLKLVEEFFTRGLGAEVDPEGFS